MQSIYQLPPETITEVITKLSLKDLVNIASVSTLIKGISRDDNLWSPRIKNDHGVTVHKENCMYKYIVIDSFENAFLNLETHPKDESGARAHQDFSKVKLMIDALTPVHEGDIGWVDYYLGFMYLSGKGVEQSFKMGIEHLSNSANMGYAKSMLLLALIYLDKLEHGIPSTEVKSIAMAEKCLRVKDYDEGRKWLTRACFAGDGEAVYIYATFCRMRLPKFETDENEKLFNIANLAVKLVDSKSVYYQKILALEEYKKTDESITYDDPTYSEKGKLDIELQQVFPDLKKIIARYTIAAKLGCAKAAFKLGVLHLDGYLDGFRTEITFRNQYEGIEWLKVAAYLKNGNACDKLGRLYRDGFLESNKQIKVAVNIKEAIKFFQLGAKDRLSFTSFENCLLALAEIYASQKDGIESNPNIAVKYCQKGVRYGSISCLIALGKLYLCEFKNAKWKRDPHMAESCFQKALYHHGFALGAIAKQISRIYASLKDAEHWNENLKQYIKWAFRGFKLEDQGCIADLKNMFDPSCKREKKPFEIEIHNVDLCQRFSEYVEDQYLWVNYKQLDDAKIIELASQVCDALGLAPIEDAFLSNTCSLVTPSNDVVCMV